MRSTKESEVVVVSDEHSYVKPDFDRAERAIDGIVKFLKQKTKGKVISYEEAKRLLKKVGLKEVNTNKKMESLISDGHIDEYKLSDFNLRGIYDSKHIVAEVYESGHGFYPAREGIARINFRHKDLAYCAFHCFCGEEGK